MVQGSLLNPVVQSPFKEQHASPFKEQHPHYQNRWPTRYNPFRIRSDPQVFHIVWATNCKGCACVADHRWSMVHGPQNNLVFYKNHMKIMVFGAQGDHPCVPHSRAVILVVGNPWVMLPQPSFDGGRLEASRRPASGRPADFMYF